MLTAAVVAAAAALATTAMGVAAPPTDEAYNPRPATDDVVLPMPCGGVMAFRRVIIPSEGPLSDRLVFVGATDGSQGYAESLRPEHIAGSFGDGQDRWYLLGKYEVSQGQYAAVMGDACPKAIAPGGALAQADVSWIDAINFADRYSLWLRRNALDKLPKADGEPGFVRLPTEVEWEFAARGGISVSDSAFRERTFPMPDGMPAYVWFAGSALKKKKK